MQEQEVHIPTIMFAAAVARPRFDTAKNQWFTGLLGIWPFCKQVRAQRSSRNRAAGTVETKPVSVDNKQHKKMMLEHILPASQ